MTELKSFIDTFFGEMRERIEKEYKHHLKNHFENIADNIDSNKFTRGHGELKVYEPRIRLPQPIEGRWWIHLAYSNIDGPNRSCTIHFYDNFGQPFIRRITSFPFDGDAPYNFQQQKQSIDPEYQYPLPNLFIDFVKKQQTIEGLNTIADMFHQIIYIYAI